MSDDLESRLVAGYEEQIGRYALALDLIEKHAAGPALDLDNIGWAGQLDMVLAEVAKIDVAMQLDKAEWKASLRSPGPAMRLALERLAAAIRALAERVDPLILELRGRREKLLPEMDLFAKQRQMIAAYSNAARPASQER